MAPARERLLVDLDGGPTPGGGAVPELAWPLADDALNDLRWYLEDYLAAPFGVYEEHGPRVEASLAEWGAAVFAAVFGSGPARERYLRVRDDPSQVRLVFRSASPELLALPWELMRDPGRPSPLALDLAGMSRSLPTGELARTFPVTGGRLRVLMVISRPAGPADVGYQMVARPLLRRLDAVRGDVDLVVLRPPTLDALGEVLTTAERDGDPFQVVHFDGHGSLGGRLVFEKPGGGSDAVPAARVARVLKEATVPVVVLNACQSGAIGKTLEAAIATRLLQEGTACVVAMAYNVYAVAAAEFMAAFYERLFAGEPVSAAVTAGRRRMFTSDHRPSPKGDLPLADWLVPVHYLRGDVSFPRARRPRTARGSLEHELDQIRAGQATTGLLELDPVGSFTGRDGLLYLLETAARLQRVVVLHGPGGTGKTELAKAFARWWRDTGGVDDPRWVIVHSFEPGAPTFGLMGVISSVGLRVFGPGFARLDLAERQAVVEKILTERRMLLVLDNFETVRSMRDPTGATPPLDEEDCQRFREFLGRLAGRGKAAVLITSRNDEEWLGDIRRIPVGGLTSRESDEYADYLLAPYPAAAPRRSQRAFGELMRWLAGHPLAMRLILPHLDTTEPARLLDGLKGTVPLPAGQDGRTGSLGASAGYSFARLAGPARRLLPVLSLVQSVADIDTLAVFSRDAGAPEPFRGATKRDWADAIEEAARVGLLTPLWMSMYRIHPALPAYLADLWRQEAPDDHDAARDAAMGALARAYVAFCQWAREQMVSGDAELGYTAIEAQRHTIGGLLAYALGHGLWDQAWVMADPLREYWKARGLTAEAEAWYDRIRLATEDSRGAPPPLGGPAGYLWLFVMRGQADQQRTASRLQEAERTSLAILEMLTAQPESRERKFYIAGVDLQLGSICLDEGRLADADDWLRGALGAFTELGDRPNVAITSHQLGYVAQESGRLDEAERWFSDSAAIDAELGNAPSLAKTHHHLGMIAQLRGRLDEAGQWYRKALDAHRAVGDELSLAVTLHQLGTLAVTSGRLDEAAAWHRQSLTIRETLGDKPGTASSCHALGIVAQAGDRLAEAEDWYLRSLTLKEGLGDKPGMALTFGVLGTVAQARGQPDRQLEWTIRCVALFDEFPHPATRTGPDVLASLTAQLGVATVAERWREVTGGPMPEAVRAYIT